MVKTKIAFITFLILLIYLIPFSYLFYWNDFLTSIIPGWDTNIVFYKLFATGIKFLILFFVTIYYWKLKKKNINVDKRLFFLHLFLTMPSIIISKFSLAIFFDFQTQNVQKFSDDLMRMNIITFTINALFFITQILFFIYYFRIKTKNNI